MYLNTHVVEASPSPPAKGEEKHPKAGLRSREDVDACINCIMTAISTKEDDAKKRAKEKAKAKATEKGQTEAKAKGKAKGKAKAKAKAKAQAKSQAKSKANSRAKQMVKRQAKVTSRTLLLGCSKCRGNHNGCAQCRCPSFQGRRFQR